MDLQDKKHAILRIAAIHGARNIRLFGCVARGEDRPDSDLDLLVEMESGRSLLDQVGLGQDLLGGPWGPAEAGHYQRRLFHTSF